VKLFHLRHLCVAAQECKMVDVAQQI
jgi:hypothetical protein